MGVRNLERWDTRLVVRMEPEMDPIKGSFHSGDPQQDREMEKDVADRVVSKGEWGWCTVIVEAHWGDFVGRSNSLSRCSYDDEQDFRKDAYFNDLAMEAVRNLNREIRDTHNRLSELVTDQHGRTVSGERMAEMLDEWVNAAGTREFEEFAEKLVHRTHRTLQQKIMSLFVACIEKWATEGQTDARNEACVALCKKIVKATGDKYDRSLPCI